MDCTTAPIRITREQANSLPKGLRPGPIPGSATFLDAQGCKKIREIARSLDIPTLEVASMSAWQFNSRAPEDVHYVITFTQSPKLWPISHFSQEKDQIDQIKAFGFVLRFHNDLIPFHFPSSFRATASSCDDKEVYTCLIGKFCLFQQPIPTLALQSEGLEEAQKELQKFIQAIRNNRNDLREIHKHNLKIWLTALSHVVTSSGLPLLTKETLAPFAQPLQLTQEEIDLYTSPKN
jgi:hypothetical protein